MHKPHIKERRRHHSSTSSWERKRQKQGRCVNFGESSRRHRHRRRWRQKLFKTAKKMRLGCVCMCVGCAGVRTEKDFLCRKGGKKKGVIPHKSGSRFPIPFPRACLCVCVFFHTILPLSQKTLENDFAKTNFFVELHTRNPFKTYSVRKTLAVKFYLDK